MLTRELSATVACAHSSNMRVAADTTLTEEVAATAGAVLPEDTPETTQSLSDVLPAGDVVPEGHDEQFVAPGDVE